MSTKIKAFVFFYLIILKIQAQQFDIHGSIGSDEFGYQVVALSNGNYIITDPDYDDGNKSSVGAVYLFNGANHQLISVLKGSNQYDLIGRIVRPLANGNFIVFSPSCANGTKPGVGAITLVNGLTGLNGVVNAENSLMGDYEYGYYGFNSKLQILSNGNFLIIDKDVTINNNYNIGAVTWFSNTIPKTGIISESNSLIGVNDVDRVGGGGVFELKNGNYVVVSPLWDNNTESDAGAITLCNGLTGTTGFVGVNNSLVGSSINDQIGNNGIGVLGNGNYVVLSSNWNNPPFSKVGAATWCDGISGKIEAVSILNSLIGNISDDQIGSEGLINLSNNNYVISSKNFDFGGKMDVGASTWGNGLLGISGFVNSGNSLIGSNSNDQIGIEKCIPLTNGNYVVVNKIFDFDLIVDAGAVTFCNGTTGLTGYINNSNSLIGANLNDQVGSGGIAILTNGNYVINSPLWDNNLVTNAGAITWGDGNIGIHGTITSGNSLVGSYNDSQIGKNKNIVLANGNYVIQNSNWNNGSLLNLGAVTWANGLSGINGEISISNSLIGSKTNDQVGSKGIYPLENGNYVICSPNWSYEDIQYAGASTWCNGQNGRSGLISVENSLIGSKLNDRVGYDGIHQLNPYSYLVRSYYSWKGALTKCNSNLQINEKLTINNSITGLEEGDYIGSNGIYNLSNGKYLIASQYYKSVGAVTIIQNENNFTGTVNNGNSIYGTKLDDYIGKYLSILSDGNFLIFKENGSDGLTFGSGEGEINGIINNCNSIFGNISRFESRSYNSTHKYLLVSRAYGTYVTVIGLKRPLEGQYESFSQTITPNAKILFISNNCKNISKLESIGNNKVSGIVNSKVWVDQVQSRKYVKRHYEINPNTNANLTTGKITLYFTQDEFDSYNSSNSKKLPNSSTDDTGKSNLIIEKRYGVSNNNTGLPNTYDGQAEIINPNDIDIKWNNSESIWEISFETEGFGGFFVKTATDFIECQSVRSGSWNDPTVWSCQQIPNSLTEVYINQGHLISIPDNYDANVKNIEPNGELKFGLNSKLQIN